MPISKGNYLRYLVNKKVKIRKMNGQPIRYGEIYEEISIEEGICKRHIIRLLGKSDTDTEFYKKYDFTGMISEGDVLNLMMFYNIGRGTAYKWMCAKTAYEMAYRTAMDFKTAAIVACEKLIGGNPATVYSQTRKVKAYEQQLFED